MPLSRITLRQFEAFVAVADLRSSAVTPNRIIDNNGRHVIRVGPVATYAQATNIRSRFSGQYPDALIVP